MQIWIFVFSNRNFDILYTFTYCTLRAVCIFTSWTFSMNTWLSNKHTVVKRGRRMQRRKDETTCSILAESDLSEKYRARGYETYALKSRGKDKNQPREILVSGCERVKQFHATSGAGCVYSWRKEKQRKRKKWCFTNALNRRWKLQPSRDTPGIHCV